MLFLEASEETFAFGCMDTDHNYHGQVKKEDATNEAYHAPTHGCLVLYSKQKRKQS